MAVWVSFVCCQACDRDNSILVFGPCARLRCSLMLFSLWIGCVVPETYENGSKSACAPTGAKRGNSWFETAGWRAVGMSEWDRIVLDKVDDVDWPGGGYSCSREVRQVVRQRGGMSQLKLRDESRRWNRQSAAVGRREDQYGRGEQVCSLEVCSCASSWSCCAQEEIGIASQML